MSFRAFIAQQKAHGHSCGDFIEDAQADREFPEATTWGEVERYLMLKNAIPEAKKMARTLWRQYDART